MIDCGLRPKFGAAHSKAVSCDVRTYIALDRPDCCGLRPKFGAAHRKVVLFIDDSHSESENADTVRASATKVGANPVRSAGKYLLS